MSEATIFSPEGATTPTGEVAKTPIVLPDSVKDLIGDGKKYATVEKALEALAPAQAHIAQLEREAAERRAAGEADNTQEVLKTVQELLAAERAKTGTSVPAVVDEAIIGGLLDRKLEERRQNAIKERNTDTVKKAMQEKFKDKAEEVYTKKATELGLSVSFLNDLVAKSPAAAFELLGLKPTTAQTTSFSKGSVNTESFTNKPVQEEHKDIMSGATTADMVGAWRRAGRNNPQQ